MPLSEQFGSDQTLFVICCLGGLLGGSSHLVSGSDHPPFIRHLGHLEGQQHSLTMDMNHLQVLGWSSKYTTQLYRDYNEPL